MNFIDVRRNLERCETHVYAPPCPVSSRPNELVLRRLPLCCDARGPHTMGHPGRPPLGNVSLRVALVTLAANRRDGQNDKFARAEHL